MELKTFDDRKIVVVQNNLYIPNKKEIEINRYINEEYDVF